MGLFNLLAKYTIERLESRLYSIGGPISIALSVYLSSAACVLWPNGAVVACGVYRSQIGMLGRHFDWHNFRPHRSALTPKQGSD